MVNGHWENHVYKICQSPIIIVLNCHHYCRFQVGACWSSNCWYDTREQEIPQSGQEVPCLIQSAIFLTAMRPILYIRTHYPCHNNKAHNVKLSLWCHMSVRWLVHNKIAIKLQTTLCFYYLGRIQLTESHHTFGSIVPDLTNSSFTIYRNMVARALLTHCTIHFIHVRFSRNLTPV